MTRPDTPPARPGPAGASSPAGSSGSFRPVLGAAVLLFIAVLAMAGVKSYRDLEAARQRKQLLESQIRSTEGEIGRLRSRIDRLRGDKGTLERLAREDLGMVRPGDVVIELPLDPVPPRPGTILPSPAVVSIPASVPASMPATPSPATPVPASATAPAAPTPGHP